MRGARGGEDGRERQEVASTVGSVRNEGEDLADETLLDAGILHGERLYVSHASSVGVRVANGTG